MTATESIIRQLRHCVNLAREAEERACAMRGGDLVAYADAVRRKAFEEALAIAEGERDFWEEAS